MMEQDSPNATIFSPAESHSEPSPVDGARPNVVFILADDLGFGDLGLYGNPLVRTPVLDAMAREGIVLTQHYSAAPICAPTRAAFLTGKYPYRTGQDMSRMWRGISPKNRTIAHAFRDAGYATALVGKWHLNGKPGNWLPNENMPWSMGFDESLMCPPFSDYWNWELLENGVPRKSDGRYLTDVLTTEAVRFIDRHRAGRFFLFLAYNAPHYPLQAREEDANLFRGSGQIGEGVAVTYGMIHRMDHGIGCVLEALKRNGLQENTIVVFTSDNGPYLGVWDGLDQDRFNGFLNGGKGVVLDGGIRVPAIIRWPAGLPARDEACTELLHITDWMPTLLQAAGLPSPAGEALDGMDVLPILRGESPMTGRKRFWSWNYGGPSSLANTAMRDGPWKLYRPFVLERSGYSTEPPVPESLISPAPPPQLFRLDLDPAERNDLAAEHPGRVRRMQQEIDAWFEGVMGDFRTAIDW